MTRVVIDASALAAVTFGELNGHAVAERLDGATVYAPALLALEMANVAWKKARRHPHDASKILRALAWAIDGGTRISWQDVNAIEVAQIAMAVGCTAYDAAYLWLAGSLGADLVTEDKRLAALTATVVI